MQILYNLGSMKWLPFFILTILLFSCKGKKDKEIKSGIKVATITDTTEEVLHGQMVLKMPVDTKEDSGYFKGYQPGIITALEETDNSQLGEFLSGLIDKRQIILLDSETLSHSVFIDQVNKKRYDTLKNKVCLITSTYDFGPEEIQQIKVNGIPVNKMGGPNAQYEDVNVMDFDNSSFRHFAFKGNKFYYIQAVVMDGHAGSIGNVTFHLIYSLKDKKFSYFETCRFSPMLFGDVDGDDQLDFLDFDNSDFCTGVPSSDRATIKIYSCNEKGEFVLRSDKVKEPWYIEGETGANYKQDSFIVGKSNWIKSLR
jgi:hypothetical protein